MTTQFAEPVASIESFNGKPAGQLYPREAAQAFAETAWPELRKVERYWRDTVNSISCYFVLVDGNRTYRATFDPESRAFVIYNA